MWGCGDNLKTLALLNGDLSFENGDFQLIDGEHEVGQCITISLGTNLKEWFLNENFGIDRLLLVEKSTEEQVRAEVMRVLAQEERITEINSVEIISDTSKRTRTIHFNVTLVDGTQLNDEVVV